MMKTTDKSTIIALFSIFFSIMWVGFTYFQNKNQSMQMFSAPQKGFLAPDFELISLEEDVFRLSDLQGNVVIVNVWASWCKPCQFEMPAMQNVYEAYSDDGLILLAVNNTAQDNLLEVTSFVKSNNLTFPILLDQTGEVSNLYQVQALPSTYFIDQNGIIQEIIIGGPMSEALIESKIIEMGIDVSNP